MVRCKAAWAFVVCPSLLAGSYDAEWASFQAAQGARSGGIPEAFKRTVDLVRSHNSKPSSFKLGYIGPFADGTARHRHSHLLPVTRNLPIKTTLFSVVDVDVDVLPSGLDWVLRGKVTPVKDQGIPDYGWAFSATGALEGARAIHTGMLVSLSEQAFVDCSKQKAVIGAWAWVKGNGIPTEESYPYAGKLGICESDYSPAIRPGQFASFVTVQDESKMLLSLNSCPVAAGIDAADDAFPVYVDGVFDGDCGTAWNHDLLIVGYGTDNGLPYWKLKNSWGNSWGEGGYMRLRRGTNKCGIAQSVTYPVFGDPSPPPSPSPSPQPLPVPSPLPPAPQHGIRSKLSGNCLDIPGDFAQPGQCQGDDAPPGRPLWAWECVGDIDGQRWLFFDNQLINTPLNVPYTMCVDVGEDGAVSLQWCDLSSNQYFTYSSLHGYIVHVKDVDQYGVGVRCLCFAGDGAQSSAVELCDCQRDGDRAWDVGPDAIPSVEF